MTTHDEGLTLLLLLLLLHSCVFSTYSLCIPCVLPAYSPRDLAYSSCIFHAFIACSPHIPCVFFASLEGTTLTYWILEKMRIHMFLSCVFTAYSSRFSMERPLLTGSLNKNENSHVLCVFPVYSLCVPACSVRILRVLPAYSAFMRVYTHILSVFPRILFVFRMRPCILIAPGLIYARKNAYIHVYSCIYAYSTRIPLYSACILCISYVLLGILCILAQMSEKHKNATGSKSG